MRGGLVGTLQTKGYSAAGAATHAAGRLYESMVQQAQILAYIDTIHMLVILTVCLIPIAYLMKKPGARPKQAIPIE